MPFKWKKYYKSALFGPRPPKNLCCSSALRQLRKRCLASIRDFYSVGQVVQTGNGVYIHRDNGAKILAVAHLDIQQPGPRHFGYKKGKHNVVYNAQLDDRLGAWIILDVLPVMGINVDILLTEGEELCQSTAAYFEPTKTYNWLIEFDRGGTDVVMYNYGTSELKYLLESQGSKVGIGTYSDISELEHLGVAGFNWGIGYYDYHFRNSHFRRSECEEALQRFAKFHKLHLDTCFPHIPGSYRGRRYENLGSRDWTEEEENCKWLRENDSGWISEMEARQTEAEAGRADKKREEEYRRQWEEAEEQRLWEEERWGTKETRDGWAIMFPAGHPY